MREKWHHRSVRKNEFSKIVLEQLCIQIKKFQIFKNPKYENKIKTSKRKYRIHF